MVEYDEMDFCGELCNFAEELIEKAKPKWIPVTERLPIGIGGELSEIVIVRTVDGEVTTGWVNPNAWWLIKVDNDYPTMQEHGYVTHWMPLPEPPKEV
jgi:hypothetical protein